MTRAINVSDVIDTSAVGALQLRVFLLCAAVLFVDGFDVQGITYVAPAISQEWGLARGALGPTFSAGLFGVMLGAILLAPLADRVGRRRVIVYSCVAFGVGTLLTLWVGSLTQLLVLRFFTGLGLGSALPNAIGLASEYAPHKRRATIVMFVGSGISLGAIGAGIAAAQLIAPFGWRAVFVVGGVLPLLLAAALARLSARIDPLRGSAAERPSRGASACCARSSPSSARKTTSRSSRTIPRAAKPRSPISSRTGAASRRCCLWVAFFMSLLNVYLAINWLPTSLNASGFTRTQAPVMTTLYHVGGVHRHVRDRAADGPARRASHGARRVAARRHRLLHVRDGRPA